MRKLVAKFEVTIELSERALIGSSIESLSDESGDIENALMELAEQELGWAGESFDGFKVKNISKGMVQKSLNKNS